jgi:hypothetical protein
MFLALVLAKSGFRPIVIERGDDADTRAQKVEAYWKNGKLDTESNVQFGEGGAGTFSDGKLMTRINDRLCSFVLETFFEHGADKDILTNAKPHFHRHLIKSGGSHLLCQINKIRITRNRYGLFHSQFPVTLGIVARKSLPCGNASCATVGCIGRNTLFQCRCSNTQFKN